MAQLGYCVSRGTPLWGNTTHPSDVLYLALEDNYARLQKRLSTMYGTDAAPNFRMAIIAKKLNAGLHEQLENHIKMYPDTRLIIIDTLKKIRDKEIEQYSYTADYDIIDNLKGFTEKHRVCLLVVHHTRKQNSDDIFDTVSGSNGLMGAADGGFIMVKQKRVEGKATIDITGRDQQDQKLHLQFDKNTFLWNLIKAENDIVAPPIDPFLEKVSKIVAEENRTWQGTATELLEVLNDEDLQPNTLTRKLNINVDRLVNEYGICYENSRTRNGSNIKLSKMREQLLLSCDDVTIKTDTL